MSVSQLIGGDLASQLSKEFEGASSVRVVSAYLTLPAVNFLFDYLPLGVKTEFIIRARPDDLKSGSCDIEAIKNLHYSGIKCFIHRSLHAKLYIIDNTHGFIGSANFTNNGLKLSGYGNLELSTRVTLSPEDCILIDHIFADATPVTSQLIKQMELFLTEQNEQISTENEWWDEIFDMTPYSVNDGLYIGDLPWCNINQPNTEDNTAHDQDVFKLGTNEAIMRQALLRSKIYKYIIQLLEQQDDKQFYFGELTQHIHGSLKDDILPYRAELKIYVANLLTYLTCLVPDRIQVDRPNYSQRIQLIN